MELHGRISEKIQFASEYEIFKQSQQYIEPNVSVCVGESDIHYNPYVYTPELVDMGLPSGTLWAKCPIGTESQEDVGLLFAWGEKTGYSVSQVGVDKNFSWADYEYATSADAQSNYGITKYNLTDGKIFLEPEDDIATILYGNKWHIPTVEQLQELIDNTDKSVSISGSNYNYVFTSKINGNQLFFRQGLAYNGGFKEGSYNVIIPSNKVYVNNPWSTSMYSIILYNYSEYGKLKVRCLLEGGGSDRCYGWQIRPVRSVN